MKNRRGELDMVREPLDQAVLSGALKPSRRSFLTGAGTGAGAAFVSLIVAAGAAAITAAK